MKKVIRCKKCGERVIYNSWGFISDAVYICPLNMKKVDLDDGCTFGHEGKPIIATYKPTTATLNYDIDDIITDACV